MTIVPNCPELLNDEQRSRLIRQQANDKRMKRERSIVRGLIRALVAKGFILNAVDDGGDELELVSNETQSLEAIFAVDEARLYFRREGETRRWMILFTVGEGDDIICDHSDTPDFTPVIEDFMRAKGLIG